MLPCFPCSSPWESNVFPHTKGGSSEICQESGECVCWTCEETSLGGFEDNGAWAPAVVYFVHAKHFTRTRGNSRSEQRHNISLSYWKGLFHLCHPISAMIALRELCLTNLSSPSSFASSFTSWESPHSLLTSYFLVSFLLLFLKVNYVYFHWLYNVRYVWHWEQAKPNYWQQGVIFQLLPVCFCCLSLVHIEQ